MLRTKGSKVQGCPAKRMNVANVAFLHAVNGESATLNISFYYLFRMGIPVQHTLLWISAMLEGKLLTVNMVL